jgi:hypothetical protein
MLSCRPAPAARRSDFAPAACARRARRLVAGREDLLAGEFESRGHETLAAAYKDLV